MEELRGGVLFVSKRILFLTYRMTQGYGVDVVVAQLSKHLTAQGHQVAIGCYQKDKTYTSLNLFEIKPEKHTVQRLCETWNPDLVVAHTSPFFELLPELTGIFQKWCYEHGDPSPHFFPQEQEERQKTKDHKKEVYSKVDGVIAISEFIRSDIGWPDAQIVYNGCNHVQGGITKKTFSSRLRIGALCRLGAGEIRYKGVLELLELFEELQNLNLPIDLSWMGKGTPDEANLIQQQGIKVFPNATEEEKWRYLTELDLLISLSQWEGCNLPLLEAQSLGTLAWASDKAAHPEITPFTAQENKEIVEAIKQYLQTPSLLKQQTLLARQWVKKKFTWEQAATDFAHIVGFQASPQPPALLSKWAKLGLHLRVSGVRGVAWLLLRRVKLLKSRILHKT